jgi:hypothetical protein
MRNAGLASGEMPEAGEARTPWYVRSMLGTAGWIGAMFLFSFVGAAFAFVLQNAAASFVTGAGLCAVAVAIFRGVPKSGALAQFGLAMSLVAQGLLLYGASQLFKNSIAGIATYAALQQALLFVLVPGYTHRVWTAVSAALAATYVMVDAGLFAFTPAAVSALFLWAALSEFRLAHRGALIRPAIYGLALASVLTSVMHGSLISALIVDHGHRLFSLGEPGLWLGRLASVAVLFWAVTALLAREGLALSSGQGRVGLAGAFILGAVSIKAPGVGPAAAILIVGYANADRVLAGLGILALLGYLSHYYYSLEVTLLAKSGLLVAAGLALLAAQLAMRYWWPEMPAGAKEANHA